MDINNNHIYIGSSDYLFQWVGHNDGGDSFSDEENKKVISKVKELIKNYLQLDNVNFLFGTGSSIHLGAASIQNIPSQIELDIINSEDSELQSDFTRYINQLQQSLIEKFNPIKDVCFLDEKGWKLIYDGTYIRNYKDEISLVDGEKDMPERHYGEILIKLESFLNYLTAISYQMNAEHNKEVIRVQKLINTLKKSLFNICDIHERKTSERDRKRIQDKGLEDAFKNNKYLFHEKFLKSLLQRPLNLQRANIFTSNYDLAFEYAFDNLGIKYIDGFSGFHHRYFKPETFNYDIFYPGSTTSGKVQRIEKVVRYFKLHGSISWIGSDNRTPNNIYGIEEMPIELIKKKAVEGDEDMWYGNLMIYPTAVKKSYTLDLPYSELFRQFAYCISRPQSVLFTIGYSFCDEHFNDIIYQALSNPTFTLIIIDYLGTQSSLEIKRLKELKDPRIIILEGDFFGDFLTLADSLMPDFLETSSRDKVADTLNQLVTKNNIDD